MNLETVMQELEALGKERMKKIYMSNGAHEPLFGVATGAMKPLVEENKNKSSVSRRALRHRKLRCHVLCRHHCGPKGNDGGGF